MVRGRCGGGEGVEGGCGERVLRRCSGGLREACCARRAARDIERSN